MRQRIADGFWRPVPCLVYAWLRIACGLLASLTMLASYDRVPMLYADGGILPRSSPAYQPPPGPNLLDWATSPEAVLICFWLLVAVGLAYALGLLTPLSGPVLWYLLVSFVNRNVDAVYGAQTLLVDMLFPLLWAPTGRVLSLDAWYLKRWRQARHLPPTPPSPTVPAVLILLRVQVAIMYLKSAFYKLMGLAWVQGDSLQYVLKNPSCRHFDLDFLFAVPGVVALTHLSTWMVIAFEASFPLLVLWRPTRRLALGLGLLNHVFIWIFVEVGMFSLVVLASYLAFADPHRVAVLGRWYRRRFYRFRVKRPASLPGGS